MFLGVELYDINDGLMHDEINVTKIVRISNRNPRNVDEGIVLYMQNGDQLMSPEPMYEFAIRRDECIKRFSIMVLISNASEFARLIKKPVRRKTTVKK